MGYELRRWGAETLESGATLPWNGWQFSRGISGSFAVESVATFVWNQWQFSRGISGNFALEWVATFAWNMQATAFATIDDIITRVRQVVWHDHEGWMISTIHFD
jgi:hypothetical protein